jgi:hypothetical protein
MWSVLQTGVVIYTASYMCIEIIHLLPSLRYRPRPLFFASRLSYRAWIYKNARSNLSVFSGIAPLLQVPYLLVMVSDFNLPIDVSLLENARLKLVPLEVSNQRNADKPGLTRNTSTISRDGLTFGLTTRTKIHRYGRGYHLALLRVARLLSSGTMRCFEDSRNGCSSL